MYWMGQYKIVSDKICTLKYMSYIQNSCIKNRYCLFIKTKIQIQLFFTICEEVKHKGTVFIVSSTSENKRYQLIII